MAGSEGGHGAGGGAWTRATWRAQDTLRQEGRATCPGLGGTGRLGVPKGVMAPQRCPPPRPLRGWGVGASRLAAPRPLDGRPRTAGRAPARCFLAPVRLVAGGAAPGPAGGFGGPDAPGLGSGHCGAVGRATLAAPAVLVARAPGQRSADLGQ